MENDKKISMIIIIILVLAVILTQSFSLHRSDIRELIENELVDEFLIVSSYLENEEEYTRKEARDAFNTIEKEISKLY